MRIMSARPARRVIALALVCWALACTAALAQNQSAVTALRNTLNELGRTVTKVEEDAFREDVTDGALAAHRADLDRLSRSILDVALAASNQLKTVSQLLTDLGAAPDAGAPPEPEEVTRERQRLSALRGEATLILRDAEQMSVQAGNLVDRINTRRSELFVRNVFSRTPANMAFWNQFTDRTGAEIQSIKRLLSFWMRSISAREPSNLAYAAALSLAVAIAIAVIVLRFAWPFFARPVIDERQHYMRRLFSALLTALVPSMSVALVLAATFLIFRGYALLPANIEQLARILFTTVAGLTFFFFLTRAVFAPNRHNWRLFEISEPAAHRLTALATAMAVVYAFDYALTQISVALYSPLVMVVGKSFFSTLLIAAILAGILHTRLDDAGDEPGAARTRGWRPWFFWLMWAVIALMVVSVLAGFISLGRFVSSQVVVTGAILVTMYVGLLSARAVSQMGALAETRLGQYLARSLKFSKLAVDQFGLVLGLSLYAAILTVGIPVVLLQWGFKRDDVLGWVGRFFEGISVGGVEISLGAIVVAIMAFAVGLVLTRIFQRWMSANILSRTRLDSGVKHSLNAGIGYLGILLAILFALQYAGLDLSGLALIAGALSVGIGFGLQNVVSNFVSGIILLIERPIRVGDWIVVGGHEGIVKKISVRATELETFDRKSVVIPNSELINTSVSNWMLKDRTGRLILEVGVSYKCDEEQVRDILYDIVRADERIAQEPEPYVFFKDFGDSALLFEVRVFLKDVNEIIRVAGDMRFAIRKAFRASAIEIPFPQRDIHMVSAEAPKSAGRADTRKTT
jgi:small-conductance mechanosensitive channel